MQDSKVMAHAARIFCFAAYLLGGYVVLKYFLPVLFPIILAFVISFVISRAAKRLSVHTKISVGVWGFLLVSALLGTCVFTVYFVCRNLVTEISELLYVFSNEENIAQPVFELMQRIPVLSGFVESSEEYAQAQIAPLIKGALTTACEKLGALLSSALGATPRTLLSGLVSIMCIYYMSVDFDGITSFLCSLLPSGIRGRLGNIKQSVLYVAVKYIRAYALLFLITLCELTVGLLIICPRYAFVAALGIALLDILPVFGAGAVLVPWSIICFVRGDASMGIGLIVLYLTVTVVRQIAEPKIIGDSVGIHPLGTLLCMYFGYRAMGVAGMVITPVAVSVIINVYSAQKKVNKC